MKCSGRSGGGLEAAERFQHRLLLRPPDFPDLIAPQPFRAEPEERGETTHGRDNGEREQVPNEELTPDNQPPALVEARIDAARGDALSRREDRRDGDQREHAARGYERLFAQVERLGIGIVAVGDCGEEAGDDEQADECGRSDRGESGKAERAVQR